MPNYKKYIKNIRQELETYIIDNNIKSLVLGVSGGADSALVALLAQPVCRILKIPLIGVSITIDSNKQDEISRAKHIGNMTCDVFTQEDFTKLYKETVFTFEHDAFNTPTKAEKIRRGNFKARIRMMYLYNMASLNNGMVLSTDNYTEYLLGFWTLHGDVGDYGMIQELWKTEVYGMLEHLRKNEADEVIDHVYIDDVINANATDGLGITNTDLDQILPGWKGNSRDGYAVVDKHLKAFRKNSDSPAVDRMNKTKFKRENPINIPRKTILK